MIYHLLCGTIGCMEKKGFEKLVWLMEHLRSPEGCPWDREQTLKSLIPYIVEEAYELCHAIEEGSEDAIKEECGDLLFQVLFVSQIAREKGWFTIDDVIEESFQKMVRRHPHVFGSSRAETAGEVLQQWAEIKKEEKAEKRREGFLSDIEEGMPALVRAQKVSKRVAKIGFDWKDIEEVVEKLEEELAELKEALSKKSAPHIEEELGDLLFTLVNIGRHSGVDPEWALARTVKKFIQRFHHLEEELRQMGKTLEEATLEEMERLWQEAKRKDNSTS